jgi:hypothetical protein
MWRTHGKICESHDGGPLLLASADRKPKIPQVGDSNQNRFNIRFAPVELVDN